MWQYSEIEIEEQTLHINHLDLKAVHLSPQKFLPHLRGHTVLVRSDNTTVVQYLNRQGGTQSPQLCLLTWDLLQLAIKNNVTVKAAHIIGSLNTLADDLSRVKISDSLTAQVLGTPMIDLLCIRSKLQGGTFLLMDSQSKCMGNRCSVCAMAEHECICFPSNTIDSESTTAHEEVPLPADFDCSSVAEETLVHGSASDVGSTSNEASNDRGSTISTQNKIVHPNPQVFNLTAWPLSTDLFKIKAFHQKLENSWQPHGELVHRKTSQQNSENLIAGVVNGKLIRIQLL